MLFLRVYAPILLSPRADAWLTVDYLTLKWIHVSAVTLSFCGFVTRGVGSLRGARWVYHPLTRRLADLVDTVLLLSAIGMLWVIHLVPWVVPWLEAKIVGLLAYITLGILALRPSRPLPVRLACFIGALLVFAYIVSVAVTKDPSFLVR